MREQVTCAKCKETHFRIGSPNDALLKAKETFTEDEIKSMQDTVEVCEDCYKQFLELFNSLSEEERAEQFKKIGEYDE